MTTVASMGSSPPSNTRLRSQHGAPAGANFQSIKIRDRLEEPNTTHNLIRCVDNEEAPIVLTPKTCLMKLPFERGF